MRTKARRIIAGFLALLMVFTGIPTMEAHMEEGISVAITMPEGADNIVLSDETPEVTLEGVTLTLTGVEGEVESIYAGYETEESFDGIWFYPTEEENEYSGEIFATNPMEGLYELLYIEIYFVDGAPLYLDSDLPSSSYCVVNNIEDVTAPEMGSCTVRANGETYELGSEEAITVTVEFADEGVGVSDTDCYVTLHAVDGDVTWYNFEKQEDGTYVTTIYMDGFDSATEWYLDEIVVLDKVGNETIYEMANGEEYYYFCLEDENGNCNVTRENVILSFCDLNGYEIANYTVSTDKRTNTLAELLETVPTFETDLGFEGWYCEETGYVLSDDTPFYINQSNQYYTFYPETELNQVMVNLYAIDEDGHMSWFDYTPYTIEEGCTYAELVKMLPEPSTIDGCKFREWMLYDYEWEDVIEDRYVNFYALYDKEIINVWTVELDKNGDTLYGVETKAFDFGITYGELIESYRDAEDVMGCRFTGWELDEMYDAEDLVEGEALIIATYDQYPVNIQRAYIGTDGTVVYEANVSLYPAGTLMEDICEEWTKVPEGIDDSEIIGWRTDYYGEEVSIQIRDLYVAAQYEDKVIVNFDVSYIEDAGGYGVVDSEVLFEAVDREKCTEEGLVEYFNTTLKNKLEYNHYKELSCTEWNVLPYDLDENGEMDGAFAEPLYEYSGVMVFLYSYEDAYVMVGEPGKSIALPTEQDGYKLIWYDMEDKEYTDTFTIPSDLEEGDVYFLYSEYGDKVITTPGEDTPSEPETPIIELEDEVVERVVKDIEDAIEESKESDENGESAKVEIDMKQEDGTVATVVPEEILEAIQGEDVDVVFDMGDYTWTINGKDVKDGTLSNINLEVKVDANAIPSDKVEELAGKNTAIQLSLTHDGEFNFAATLTINVGKEYAGQYVNLYFYNEKGEFVPMASALVDKDGNVSLVFEHASDYVMVVSDKPLAQSPITVEDVNIGMYVSVLLSGIGLAIVALKKRASN